jgi:NAD+ kinase
MNIALYGRSFATDCSAPIKELVALLQARAAGIAVYRPFYDFLQQTYDIRVAGVALYDEMPPPPTDCLISIGGDGTFLRSLKQVRHSGIPVIGINGGRLGFLSEATFDTLPETIDALAQKNYTIEERTVLAVQSDALPEATFAYALNEVGIQRHSPAMISVHVQLNDERLPTYWSDGLLVATPTGSTAYSMSVGGPIVVPPSKNFVLSPIAPHNLNIRSLVISDDSILTLTVETRNSNAFLTIDNQLIEINSGTKITVRKADFPFRIIRLHGSRFFDTLREKLSWGKDSRNPY